MTGQADLDAHQHEPQRRRWSHWVAALLFTALLIGPLSLVVIGTFVVASWHFMEWALTSPPLEVGTILVAICGFGVMASIVIKLGLNRPRNTLGLVCFVLPLFLALAPAWNRTGTWSVSLAAALSVSAGLIDLIAGGFLVGLTARARAAALAKLAGGYERQGLRELALQTYRRALEEDSVLDTAIARKLKELEQGPT